MIVRVRVPQGSVVQYRLYFLDGAGCVAGPPYEFEADNDETAIKVADAWREGRRMELWRRARRVEVWGA